MSTFMLTYIQKTERDVHAAPASDILLWDALQLNKSTEFILLLSLLLSFITIIIVINDGSNHKYNNKNTNFGAFHTIR